MTEKIIRIAVAGALGRMGRTILALARENKKFSIAGALEAPGHPQLGQDVGDLLHFGKLGIYLTDRPDYAVKNASVLVTFTTPEATLEHLRASVKFARQLVIGTTGLKDEHDAAIRRASRKIGIVQAPNMSVGVNLLLRLVSLAAQKLDSDYDVEIVETHHRMKKDAPSGTALKIAETVAAARGIELKKAAVYGRCGMTDGRERGAIGVHAIRGGDVVGEHTVRFMGVGERLGFFHEASSREAFAGGALVAAEFLSVRKHGLWSMQDVLGL